MRSPSTTDYVTDTQALIEFMIGKKVINEQCHQAFSAADRRENIVIIPAVGRREGNKLVIGGKVVEL